MTVSLVFTVNICLSLATAMVTSDGLIITDFKQIRKHYLQTGGISEILATPPLGLLYYFLSPNPNLKIVNSLAMNRVLMVLRQVKLRSKAIKYWIMHSNVLLILVTLAGTHILACIWFGLGEWLNDGWVRAREEEILDEVAQIHEQGQEEGKVYYHYGIVNFRKNQHEGGFGLYEAYLLSFYQVRHLHVHSMFTERSLNVPWMFSACSLNVH
jgi:hypothetical protein